MRAYQKLKTINHYHRKNTRKTMAAVLGETVPSRRNNVSSAMVTFLEGVMNVGDGVGGAGGSWS